MNGEGLGLELLLGVLLQGGKGDLWRFVEGMLKLDHYGSRMLSQDEDTKLHVDMDLWVEIKVRTAPRRPPVRSMWETSSKH
jgi:hypothetical protein